MPDVVERLVGLHPRGRAPGNREHLGLRVDAEHLAQRGQHVRHVVGDREAHQLRIALARRLIVVGVRRAVHREVGCADRHEREVQVDAVQPEQVLHQLVTAARSELLLDQPGGGVRHRRADAAHPLVADPVAYVDHREATRALRGELDVPKPLQPLGKAGAGLRHLDVARGACCDRTGRRAEGGVRIRLPQRPGRRPPRQHAPAWR